MSPREQDLDAVGPVYASFNVKQTAGSDDLTDADIGKAVTVTDDNEVGPCTDNSVFVGRLVDLTLTDAEEGERIATVQVKGIMTVPVAATVPVVGNRVVGAAAGAVKQAPALGGNDPAGGNISRGTVIAVNGTTDCKVLL
ncbi:MAG: hypothetical protein L0Y74_03570 [candidate division Zixibacteria bacterium]|nr:hypothetical protein [candidate division Zixibacteria bacterium]